MVDIAAIQQQRTGLETESIAIEAENQRLSAQRAEIERRNAEIERQRQETAKTQEQLSVIRRMGGDTRIYEPFAVKAQEEYFKTAREQDTTESVSKYNIATQELTKRGEQYNINVGNYGTAIGVYNKEVEARNKEAQESVSKLSLTPSLSDVDIAKGLFEKGYFTEEAFKEYESVAQQNIKQKEFSDYLGKVAAGQESVEDISINTFIGSRYSGYGSSRSLLGDRYSEGTTQGLIQEQLDQWAIQGTRNYLGLGAEDRITINGRVVQESSFTPEQKAIAGQVFSGRMTALAAYNRERELEQDRLKAGMLMGGSAKFASPSAYIEAYKGYMGTAPTASQVEATPYVLSREQLTAKAAMLSSPTAQIMPEFYTQQYSQMKERTQAPIEPLGMEKLAFNPAVEVKDNQIQFYGVEGRPGVQWSRAANEARIAEINNKPFESSKLPQTDFSAFREQLANKKTPEEIKQANANDWYASRTPTEKAIALVGAGLYDFGVASAFIQNKGGFEALNPISGFKLESATMGNQGATFEYKPEPTQREVLASKVYDWADAGENKTTIERVKTGFYKGATSDAMKTLVTTGALLVPVGAIGWGIKTVAGEATAQAIMKGAGYAITGYVGGEVALKASVGDVGGAVVEGGTFIAALPAAAVGYSIGYGGAGMAAPRVANFFTPKTVNIEPIQTRTFTVLEGFKQIGDLKEPQLITRNIPEGEASRVEVKAFEFMESLNLKERTFNVRATETRQEGANVLKTKLEGELKLFDIGLEGKDTGQIQRGLSGEPLGTPEPLNVRYRPSLKLIEAPAAKETVIKQPAVEAYGQKSLGRVIEHTGNLNKGYAGFESVEVKAKVINPVEGYGTVVRGKILEETTKLPSTFYKVGGVSDAALTAETKQLDITKSGDVSTVKVGTGKKSITATIKDTSKAGKIVGEFKKEISRQVTIQTPAKSVMSGKNLIELEGKVSGLQSGKGEGRIIIRETKNVPQSTKQNVKYVIKEEGIKTTGGAILISGAAQPIIRVERKAGYTLIPKEAVTYRSVQAPERIRASSANAVITGIEMEGNRGFSYEESFQGDKLLFSSLRGIGQEIAGREQAKNIIGASVRGIDKLDVTSKDKLSFVNFEINANANVDKSILSEMAGQGSLNLQGQATGQGSLNLQGQATGQGQGQQGKQTTRQKQEHLLRTGTTTTPGLKEIITTTPKKTRRDTYSQFYTVKALSPELDITKGTKKKAGRDNPLYPASLENVTREEFNLGGKRAKHIRERGTTQLLFKRLQRGGTSIPTKAQFERQKSKKKVNKADDLL